MFKRWNCFPVFGDAHESSSLYLVRSRTPLEACVHPRVLIDEVKFVIKMVNGNILLNSGARVSSQRWFAAEQMRMMGHCRQNGRTWSRDDNDNRTIFLNTTVKSSCVLQTKSTKRETGCAVAVEGVMLLLALIYFIGRLFAFQSLG